ncbi:hypothetical protein [Prevotella sp. 10(H)]|uniref:hypothetical protein n=1 Tax=Prevotella sp. 10(H) TaxID=1158294 RepID=UPI000AC8DC7C|nr:hypothetical protein [Prevotella sp. 10(H)]
MKNEKMKKEYVSPLIEIIEVEVEEGFAMSTGVEIRGASHNFTSNSFGNGDGGNTMGDF